jgi:hypothetical protein
VLPGWPKPIARGLCGGAEPVEKIDLIGGRGEALPLGLIDAEAESVDAALLAALPAQAERQLRAAGRKMQLCARLLDPGSRHHQVGIGLKSPVHQRVEGRVPELAPPVRPDREIEGRCIAPPGRHGKGGALRNVRSGTGARGRARPA